MSEIHVESIETIQYLERRLAETAGGLADALQAISASSRKHIEALEDRCVRCQHRLEYLEQLMSEADDEEDTSGIEAQVENAREALQNCMRWQNRAVEAYEQFRRQAHAASELSTSRTEASRAFLTRKIEALRTLRSITSGGDAGGRSADLESNDAPSGASSAGVPGILPDGRHAIIGGDPSGRACFNHEQGRNELGYSGTCGIVCCESILNMFGVGMSEADIISWANADGRELFAVSDDPWHSGGTRPDQQAQILSGLGVPAVARHIEATESLAELVDQGHGVMIEVESSVLGGNPPRSTAYDHAVVVTGTARDPETMEVLGVFINNSGAPYPSSATFVDAEMLDNAWLSTGGWSVVTDETIH